MINMIDYWLSIKAYRDTLWVHVLEAEVVRLQQVQLFAHLLEQHATRGLRLKHVELFFVIIC